MITNRILDEKYWDKISPDLTHFYYLVIPKIQPSKHACTHTADGEKDGHKS